MTTCHFFFFFHVIFDSSVEKNRGEGIALHLTIPLIWGTKNKDFKQKFYSNIFTSLSTRFESVNWASGSWEEVEQIKGMTWPSFNYLRGVPLIKQSYKGGKWD